MLLLKHLRCCYSSTSAVDTQAPPPPIPMHLRRLRCQYPSTSTVKYLHCQAPRLSTRRRFSSPSTVKHLDCPHDVDSSSPSTVKHLDCQHDVESQAPPLSSTSTESTSTVNTTSILKPLHCQAPRRSTRRRVSSPSTVKHLH